MNREQITPTRLAPKRNFATRLFGYDVFVSFALGPPPRGSHSYASDLARRLRERDFTVFFSEDEAPVGDQLDRTLQRALKRSKTLVVIANRGTLTEPRWVRTEVEEFRRYHPDRPVIPISIGGALQDPYVIGAANDWLRFQDRIWVDESEQAGAAGIVSENVVARLATAPAASRANNRWRAIVYGIIVLLTSLAGLASWWAYQSNAAEKRAREELQRTLALHLLAGSQSIFAGSRKGGEERALLQLIAAHRLAPSIEVEAELLPTLLRLRGLRRLVGPVPSLSSVALSPDGEQLATGDLNGFVRMWNADGMQIGKSVQGHGASVQSIAYSPRARRIVSAGYDGTLRLWDAVSGQPLPIELPRHRNRASVAVFSADGQRGASGGGGDTMADAQDRHSGRQPGARDYDVLIWDAQTGQSVGAPFSGHTGAVRAIGFSGDGQLIASSGADRSIRLWRIEDRLAQHLDGLTDDPVSIALSWTGAEVAFGTADGTLYLWKTKEQPARALPITRSTHPAIGIHFDATGKLTARLANGARLR